MRYKNEVFNKLYEYNGYDIIAFLDFYYSAFDDKQTFLQFPQYEISGRLMRKPREAHRQKLQSSQEWVTQKQLELQFQQQATLRQEIEKDIREALPAETPVSQESIENIANALSQKFADHLVQIMASTEERMKSLTDSYIIGKIELNNQNHKTKLMNLFRILQTVQAPHQIARGEQLFKSFSDTDAAAILWLHFVAFNNKKIETIPKNIREADELIPDSKQIESSSCRKT